MMFIFTTTQNQLYGKGRPLGNNCFELSKGLKVFFYDDEAVEKEFSPYGIIEDKMIEESIKFQEGHDSILEPTPKSLFFATKAQRHEVDPK